MPDRIKELIKGRYTREQIWRLSWAVLIFILACLVWGCGGGERVTEYYPVYREVKVPVPCDVALPARPSYEGNPVIDNLNILQYAEELELTLNICIRQVNNEAQDAPSLSPGIGTDTGGVSTN